LWKFVNITCCDIDGVYELKLFKLWCYISVVVQFTNLYKYQFLKYRSASADDIFRILLNL